MIHTVVADRDPMSKSHKTFALVARLVHQNLLFISLVGSSVFCLCLPAIRIAFTHHSTYSFMVRNLILAWPALISAYIVHKIYQKQRNGIRIAAVICSGIWLVFLPNAPYLITDFVHFSPRDDISLWFDLIMFAAFAVTGLFYGCISVYWMQQLVTKTMGTAAGWLFVTGVSVLSSFGIYLGRFQRWNSWDVISHPLGLVGDVWQNFRHPIAHFQMFVFSALFTVFLLSTYLVVSALAHLSRE